MGERYIERYIDMQNRIREYLKSREYEFEYDNKNLTYNVPIKLKNQVKEVTMQIALKQDSYQIYAIAPFVVNAREFELVSKMAIRICGINHRLRFGCFDYEWGSGEIRYHIAIACKEDEPTYLVFDQYLGMVERAWNRFGDKIAELVLDANVMKEAQENKDGGKTEKKKDDTYCIENLIPYSRLKKGEMLDMLSKYISASDI